MVRKPLPRGLKRAIERLEAEPARRWRLSDLAAVSGVAPRTLQKQFLRFVGTAPLTSYASFASIGSGSSFCTPRRT